MIKFVAIANLLGKISVANFFFTWGEYMLSCCWDIISDICILLEERFNLAHDLRLAPGKKHGSRKAWWSKAAQLMATGKAEQGDNTKENS